MIVEWIDVAHARGLVGKCRIGRGGSQQAAAQVDFKQVVTGVQRGDFVDFAVADQQRTGRIDVPDPRRIRARWVVQ